MYGFNVCVCILAKTDKIGQKDFAKALFCSHNYHHSGGPLAYMNAAYTHTHIHTQTMKTLFPLPTVWHRPICKTHPHTNYICTRGEKQTAFHLCNAARQGQAPMDWTTDKTHLIASLKLSFNNIISPKMLWFFLPYTSMESISYSLRMIYAKTQTAQNK